MNPASDASRGLEAVREITGGDFELATAAAILLAATEIINELGFIKSAISRVAAEIEFLKDPIKSIDFSLNRLERRSTSAQEVEA
jgi:hypothetical protein